jgi:flagellar motility protein MotE (MotC chaperone)
MNRLHKYFRLLPAVFVLGIGVLALKGVDLARAAQVSASASAAPDNAGLAPADTGGTKSAPDFAVDENIGDSSAAVDVLTSLTRRRAELDGRERALNMRENVLVAGEGRVDQKIAALKALQTQIQSLLSQRDAAQDKQIASLVKTYSSMKPKDAARIFDTLTDEVLLPVAKGMKSDALAPVMAAMNPEAAQRLTVKLAALLKLPEALPAADCPAAAAPTPASLTQTPPPLPGTIAAVTPAAAPAVQTAALAPPTPQAAAAPAQAGALPPPKARKPAPRKTAAVKPASAETAPPKPATNASAAPTANPATAPAPVKADTSPSTPPPAPATTPVKGTPAPSQAAVTPRAPAAAPTQAIGPPAAITPAKGG